MKFGYVTKDRLVISALIALTAALLVVGTAQQAQIVALQNHTKMLQGHEADLTRLQQFVTQGDPNGAFTVGPEQHVGPETPRQLVPRIRTTHPGQPTITVPGSVWEVTPNSMREIQPHPLIPMGCVITSKKPLQLVGCDIREF